MRAGLAEVVFAPGILLRAAAHAVLAICLSLFLNESTTAR